MNIAPKLVQVGPWLELGAAEGYAHFRPKELAGQDSPHQQRREEEELIGLAPFQGKLELEAGAVQDLDS